VVEVDVLHVVRVVGDQAGGVELVEVRAEMRLGLVAEREESGR